MTGEVETRRTHYYRFYGRTLTGYGSSMDPHRCGDPSEPCVTITEERTVSPWVEVSRTSPSELASSEPSSPPSPPHQD